MSNSLATVHPELVAEWSEKNLPLTPDSITFGSNKKVWWKGACGHEWEISIKARSSGEKCPICSGARVIAGINDLAILEPLLVKQWSKKNKIKPTEVSIGSHKKVIWRCEKGHEWIATVKSRTINKTGCPYCSHNKVLAGFNDLATLFPEVADEWSDENEKKPTEVTAFANSKAWWKCKVCGYEWNTLISTRSGGSKCPCCSGYTFIKGKNDLKSTHPLIAKEWSEKNYPLQPDEVNAKSRKNVWWHCRKCGNEWKSVINARVKGLKVELGSDRLFGIPLVVLFGAAVAMFGGGSDSNSYTPVSAEVEAYEPIIQKYAKEYGIPEYVELIKAVMMQESGGAEDLTLCRQQKEVSIRSIRTNLMELKTLNILSSVVFRN